MPESVTTLGNPENGTPTQPPYLIPYILLKILLACDVQAHAALAETLCLDLVICAWDGGDDNVRDC